LIAAAREGQCGDDEARTGRSGGVSAENAAAVAAAHRERCGG